MNRILSIAFALSLMSLTACASRPPQATTTVPASRGATSSEQCMKMSDRATSNEQAAPTTNKIQVLTVTPPVGSSVQKSTVLVTDLVYDVKDFDSGKYTVIAQFDTNTSGRSTDGTFNSYPVLKYASGSYRLCFPLTDVWSAPDVKKPLSVRFMLNKIDDAHHSHPIAITDRLSFPSN
jgi:hypothetical protein